MLASPIRRLATISQYIALLTVVLAPFAVLAVAQTKVEKPAQVFSAPIPIVVAIRADVEPTEFDGRLTLESTPSTRVNSSGEGLITKLELSAGDRLSQGAPVLQVDGRDRLAFQATTPLYRPLSVGAIGTDVADLQTFLLQAGFYAGQVNGQFDASLRDAVRLFARWFGYGDRLSEFQPAWVIWIGPEPATVEEVLTSAGAFVSQHGPLLTLQPPPPRLLASTDPGVPASALDGATAVVNGTDIGIVRGGEVVDVTDQMIGSAFSSDADENGSEPTSVEAVFRSHETTPVEIVPASAVVAIDGSTCIWIKVGTSFEPRPVVVLDGSLGSAVLQANSNADDGEVLANPMEVLATWRCS